MPHPLKFKAPKPKPRSLNFTRPKAAAVARLPRNGFQASKHLPLFGKTSSQSPFTWIIGTTSAGATHGLPGTSPIASMPTPAHGAVIRFTHEDSLSTARNGGLGLGPGQSQLRLLNLVS